MDTNKEGATLDKGGRKTDEGEGLRRNPSSKNYCTKSLASTQPSVVGDLSSHDLLRPFYGYKPIKNTDELGL